MRFTICTLGLALAVFAQDAAEKRPAYLGIGFQPVSRASSQPDAVHGLKITGVAPDSGAARAGWKKDDVLIAIGGKEIDSLDVVHAELGKREPGDEIAYVLLRDNGRIEGTVVLGARPEAEDVKRAAPDDLDARLDALRERMAEAERLAQERRRVPQPRNLGAWIEREKRALAEAAERGDERAVGHHEARLGLLLEMRKQGFGRRDAAPRPPQKNRWPERVERLEKRVAQLMERIERLEAARR